MAKHNPAYHHWRLAAIGDDESETLLGEAWLPREVSHRDASAKLMAEFWDPRLDAASCIPCAWIEYPTRPPRGGQ